MSDYTIRQFRPRDGAILDIGSLEAVASVPSDLLQAALVVRWPDCQGLILTGLELQGEMAPAGPPGTVRPDAEIDHAVLTPGSAVLRGRDGRLHVFHMTEPVRCDWPDETGPRVRGVLVAFTDEVRAASTDGLAVAADDVTVRVGFVKPHLADQPHLLPLASAIGNGRDWSTDLARVVQPEHPIIRRLLKHVDALDQSVWQAEPEGSVWDRQVLGRSWVRYQTVAAAALQAARATLSMQATTTLERVRILTTLRHQLDQSVERVATELLQIVGSPEGAGLYGRVLGSKG